ncbi:MFS transporter permease [Aurantimonas sp. VKM B-3413]|uniref:MFS transporter permease n=1 Tax=Aurantimonas sp. VKM B-3413 TaxID=2779401 RepID=UPI001E54D8D0|nr:MFS transporter permease [Aurantimonas sp. VKM B-3413]MCB8837728.1 MFS transporter permease [Aurantimonas sp. VKM B-3413]
MNTVGQLQHLFSGDEENRVCKDIPESACRHQPRNAGLHLVSMTATKIGDGLLDPKLILPFLLHSVGAPGAAIGMLVPVRESLALLPQILVSHRVRAMPRRKWAWAAGSAVEGLAVAGIALTLAFFDGSLAGWLSVGLLAVFALGRSLASVSHKDVLGKTVAKTRRGTITGIAGSIGAAVVFAYGAALAFGLLPLERGLLLIGLAVAAGLWGIAAFVFTLLDEEAGATGGGENGLSAILSSGRRLWRAPQFRAFVVARALLTATALAPPYLLLSAGADGGRALGSLGAFVIASSVAAVLGSTVWGTMSDRSSRKVLALSGALGAVVLAASAAAALFLSPDLWQTAAPFSLFVLMMAYQGVRLGRKTYLVDMAPADDRAIYTAFSNTAIGVVLLVMGAFGLLAEALGAAAVLIAFALLCAASVPVALKLDEVQSEA